MIFRGKTFSQFSVRIILTAVSLLSVLLLTSTAAYAAVTSITPSTWNIIGLDSNNPAFGPNRFPVGAQVCSNSAGPVTAQLHWDSGGTTNDDSVIKLRPITGDTISLNFTAAGCLDAFFEVEVSKALSSHDATRRYHITAGGMSTPTPRELKVERLVSQSRNAISDMRFATTLAGLDNPASSVPSGGSFDLTVGRTYYIRMSGYTATQGYEQLESFVNFPNTIFRVLSVSTKYSADTSPIVNSPNDKLYADSCGWDNDPGSPSYLSCAVDGKAGGQVEVTYKVEIVSTAGSSQETLNSLIHDFSGSSFHYNADYSTSARFANIINPNDLTITKSFAPTPIAAGGSSTMTIAISNPTYGTISGLAFTDLFPTVANIDPPPTTAASQMSVAATPGIINSCGGTLFDYGTGANGTLAAGDVGLQLSGGSVPGLGTCLIKVNVTTEAVEGRYDNTTGTLSAEGSSTGKTSNTASLVVDNDAFQKPTPPSSCVTRTEMVRWNMNNAPATSPPTYSSKHDDVNGAVTLASYTGSGTQSIDTTDPGTGNYSWIATNGWPTTTGYYGPDGTPYFQFAVDTSRFGNVQIHFDYIMKPGSDWGGTNKYYVDSSDDGVTWTTLNSSPYTATKGSWQTGLINTAAATSNTITYFRLRFAGAKGTGSPVPVVGLDNVWFDGCAIVPTDPPTISKVFSQPIVAQGDTSTLTFTITNPNVTPALALSGVTVTDAFPTGLTVAAPLTTSNTCGGTLSDHGPGANGILEAGDTGIRLNGGSIIAPAGSPRTCTFSVNVKTPMPTVTPPPATITYDNTSGAVAASESGANTDSTPDQGIATASLKTLAPPTITKAFSPDTIFTENTGTGDLSTLTFTLDNPNTADALSGVTFTDIFPVAAGMSVASPLTTTNTCGGTLRNAGDTANLAATDTGLRLINGALAAGGSCTVSVVIEAATSNTIPYTNTTSNFYHVVAPSTYQGAGINATDDLLVETAAPGIALLKQAGPSNTGPWSSYLAVAPNGPVYYKFTVENTGDVNLGSVYVSDQAGLPAPLNMDDCAWRDGDNNLLALSPPSPRTFSLPKADADNGHLATCILGPAMADSAASPHDNTARAHGTFGATTVTADDTATYATTAVTLTKTADKTYYMAAGETINYTYAINNSGANLTGPLTITVTDNKIASVDCTNAVANSIVTATGLPGIRDGNLYTGESAICTASYTVTASDLIAEQIVNIARANIKDTVTLNINTPQASATVLAGPDLVVTKTNSVGGAGSTNVPFNWILTARNTTSLGMTATFANTQRLLVDHLPPGPTYSAPAVATNTGGTTGTISCAIAANVLTCSATGAVAIPPDGGFTIAVTTTPAAAGILTNPSGGDCRIDPDGVAAEINNDNNDCSDTVTVTTPAVTLTKTADKSYFTAAGEVIAYTYKVRNTGANILGAPTTVTITITDDKVAVTCPPITAAIPGGNNDFETNEELTCTSTAPHYTVLADDVTAREVTNLATATVTPGAGPPVLSPQVSLTVPLGPDLSVVKTNNLSGAANPSIPFSWLLTAANSATAGYAANFADTEVILIDDLPDNNATYALPAATATNTGGATGTVSCAIAANSLTCSAAGPVSVPPGGGFTIEIETTAATPGTLLNPRNTGICRIDPGTLLSETAEDNNDCSDTVTVGFPLLAITKVASTASAQPGGTINYTVLVTNNGNALGANVVLRDQLSSYTEFRLDTYGAGTPFSFTDSIPASGLSLGVPQYSDNNGTDWIYTPGATGYNGNITDWRIPMTGTIRPGGSFTLNYQVKVK